MSLTPRETAGRRPVLLVVMDGVGVGRADEGDAVHLARTPTLDALRTGHPYLTLKAHGTAVGLPSDADMGNSEVGHNTIGAGRVFAQGAKLVNAALASGALFAGPTWRALIERVRGSGGTLHLLGLVSDGNVHSHLDHLLALLARAAAEGVTRARVHTLLDGRDVPETSALVYVDRLEAALAELRASGKDYAIASGGGRMKITMDRYEADWPMVERGWRTHVHADAEPFPSARAAIEAFRARTPGIIDQDLPAFVVAQSGGAMQDGDAVVLFNFRGDRALEISRAFEDDVFPHFDRGRRPDVLYAGLMQYDGDYQIPKRYLVEPPAIEGTLGQLLARAGRRQFACSETQKYGHVTYFFNGNRGGKFDEALETYQEVPSDRVSFAERPWMKAAEITDATIAALESGRFDFLRINYANGDMVGHTGHRDATILAVEAVDLCLARLLPAVARAGGVALITADHGNADEMYQYDEKKKVFRRTARGTIEPKTSHTLNPVPLHLYDPTGAARFREGPAEPGLANLAATILELLGFRAPADFERSLLA